VKAKTTVQKGTILLLIAVAFFRAREVPKAATSDMVTDLQATEEGLPDALAANQGIDDINRLLGDLRKDSAFAADFYKTMKSNEQLHH